MKVHGKSSIRTLVGLLLVLFAAVGIGIFIREYRLESYLEKRTAQAPKANQQAEPIEKKQRSHGPEPQYTKEQLLIEEVNVEPESRALEPVRAPMPIVAGGGQSGTGVEADVSAEPIRNEPDFDESAIKEKRAREALGRIGYDPEADEVWIETINDPSVSANARSNLIEDLNEDGFPDPHNPTLDDLPVIEYRIQLIEELAPYAMDKVNADAFAEAHKDLVNMANRLRRQ